MKNFCLAAAFLINSLIMAQKNGVLPPANVKIAFEKQYPKKSAIWSVEHDDEKNDKIFKAKFNETTTTKATAFYDSSGSFKSYKIQVSIDQLPYKAQLYLKKEYPAKPFRKIILVIDDKNIKTYRVRSDNNAKLNDIVFNKDGEAQW
jgi:hypothetical protein